MNIKKSVQISFVFIVISIVAIFTINSIVLIKIKENQSSRKEITKLVLMQDNMNSLVSEIIDSKGLDELDKIKNEFIINEKSFEETLNKISSEDVDDILDLFIQDLHKYPRVAKNLSLISKSEKIIEDEFNKIFNLQKRIIVLSNLFEENYPKESSLRDKVESDILKTKNIQTIKQFSDIKYYGKEVLFQHKNNKYLNIWLDKANSLKQSYTSSKLDNYIAAFKSVANYALELDNLKTQGASLQSRIEGIVNKNKKLNTATENEIETLSANFFRLAYAIIITLLIATIAFIIYLAFKVNRNVSLGFNEIEYKVQAGLQKIKALNKEIESTQKEVVFTMGAIGESRSKETGNHVKRVAEYSRILALYYGLSKEEAELLKQASPMHDIGKVAIPDSILNKPGRFDEKEREIMNTHAQLGYGMLKHSDRPLLKAAAIVALEHHEKWDGSGYPRKMKGEEIHIFGRITALADVFDALGSDRCYKKAWDDERIFKLFKEERGKHFDPKLIDIFFEHLDEFLKIRDTFKDV